MKNSGRPLVRRRRYASIALLAVATALGWSLPANAYTFNTSPDWDIELNTNLAYTLGVRADKMNPDIGNNPIQQNSEYKFPKQWDATNNRFDVSSEFSAVYQQNYGFDTSVSAWKDFAYGNTVNTHPGDYAPGVPYSALSSEPSGHYASYTNYYYNQGIELGSAFVFANLNVDNVPVSVKVGRFTEYWGNALFSGFQAISTGQSPIDEIKAVDAPGTEVKDLFLPRGQVTVHAQLTPTFSVGFQYYFEYRETTFPEGGTFLGVADPFFIGPTTLPGTATRGTDPTPPNVDANFGVETLWAPDWLQGTLGAYFRQYDDPTPYGAFALNVTTATPTYHLAFARHIQLYGLSFDRNVGSGSVDVETSIMANAGLNTLAGGAAATGNPAYIALDPAGDDGARGNVWNVVANDIYGLPRSRFFDTGSLIGEVAFSHLLGVTHDKYLYNGVGYPACANGRTGGCSTPSEVNFNVLFDPQWLQVYPGVDIDAPLSLSMGLWGNGQTLGTAGLGNLQDSEVYSAAVHALIKQKYNVTLKYSGFNALVGPKTLTPSGLPYYASGSGQYNYNDKANITLVLSTLF